MTFTFNALNIPTSTGERGTFKFSSDVTSMQYAVENLRVWR